MAADYTSPPRKKRLTRQHAHKNVLKSRAGSIDADFAILCGFTVNDTFCSTKYSNETLGKRRSSERLLDAQNNSTKSTCSTKTQLKTENWDSQLFRTGTAAWAESIFPKLLSSSVHVPSSVASNTVALENQPQVATQANKKKKKQSKTISVYVTRRKNRNAPKVASVESEDDQLRSDTDNELDELIDSNRKKRKHRKPRAVKYALGERPLFPIPVPKPLKMPIHLESCYPTRLQLNTWDGLDEADRQFYQRSSAFSISTSSGAKSSPSLWAIDDTSFSNKVFHATPKVFDKTAHGNIQETVFSNSVPLSILRHPKIESQDCIAQTAFSRCVTSRYKQLDLVSSLEWVPGCALPFKQESKQAIPKLKMERNLTLTGPANAFLQMSRKSEFEKDYQPVEYIAKTLTLKKRRQISLYPPQCEKRLASSPLQAGVQSNVNFKEVYNKSFFQTRLSPCPSRIPREKNPISSSCSFNRNIQSGCDIFEQCDDSSPTLVTRRNSRSLSTLQIPKIQRTQTVVLRSDRGHVHPTFHHPARGTSLRKQLSLHHIPGMPSRAPTVLKSSMKTIEPCNSSQQFSQDQLSTRAQTSSIIDEVDEMAEGDMEGIFLSSALSALMSVDSELDDDEDVLM